MTCDRGPDLEAAETAVAEAWDRLRAVEAAGAEGFELAAARAAVDRAAEEVEELLLLRDLKL